MKTTGIVLIILGVLSTIGSINFAANGRPSSQAGLVFIALGAFLIFKANKKKDEKLKE